MNQKDYKKIAEIMKKVNYNTSGMTAILELADYFEERNGGCGGKWLEEGILQVDGTYQDEERECGELGYKCHGCVFNKQQFLKDCGVE